MHETLARRRLLHDSFKTHTALARAAALVAAKPSAHDSASKNIRFLDPFTILVVYLASTTTTTRPLPRDEGRPEAARPSIDTRLVLNRPLVECLTWSHPGSTPDPDWASSSSRRTLTTQFNQFTAVCSKQVHGPLSQVDLDSPTTS
jgi:hypothetical protein